MSKTDFKFVQERWDFKSCPKSELEICCLYEYACESSLFKSFIHDGVQDSRALDKFSEDAENRIYSFGEPAFFKLLQLSLEFPVIPWLLIPKSERQKRIKQAKYPSPDPDAQYWIVSLDECLSIARPSRNFWDSEVFTFSVDWRIPDKIYQNWFRNWLNEQRPKDISKYKKGRSHSARDRLNALGAFRLLRQLGDAEKVADFIDKHQNTKAMYNDERAVRRAAKNAERRIDFYNPPELKSRRPDAKIFRARKELDLEV